MRVSKRFTAQDLLLKEKTISNSSEYVQPLGGEEWLFGPHLLSRVVLHTNYSKDNNENMGSPTPTFKIAIVDQALL